MIFTRIYDFSNRTRVNLISKVGFLVSLPAYHINKGLLLIHYDFFHSRKTFLWERKKGLMKKRLSTRLLDQISSSEVSLTDSRNLHRVFRAPLVSREGTYSLFIFFFFSFFFLQIGNTLNLDLGMCLGIVLVFLTISISHFRRMRVFFRVRCLEMDF